MGKITGFLEFDRIEEPHAPVAERVGHFREFVSTLTADAARQQAARCMDCGVPFCSHGCPVNNIIPDFNDLVYRDDWKNAFHVLDSTNNFPEFTGRICPAPCEAACTLNINSAPVGIKSLERAIIDRAWAEGWVLPRPAPRQTGRAVAVVGSGPAGLAAAQQLARAGHAVTVFEKNDRLGGLLRYGIPDFKLDKSHIDRRIAQMQGEGVVFRPGVLVGDWPAEGAASRVTNLARETILPDQLLQNFDAVLLAGGCEQSRDLPVPGRSLRGIHFAMEMLPQQNRIDAGDRVRDAISAKGRHVIVIGGGDTGSDCVGTCNRQGAASVTQFELMPMPPLHEDKLLTWPYWPIKLRTSDSHDEGVQREFAIATQGFIGRSGRVRALKTVQIEMQGGQPTERPGTEREWPADLVLLAMGFTNPVAAVLAGFGVDTDRRGNARAGTSEASGYRTNARAVFAAGDMRRGQSLVVWAIREGRQVARAIDQYLMSRSDLPR
ncbi:MAG TPA: glutamate synthase subunit beta [Ottowia sp.]|uniref:glutamate synthase subunit beta n=1 Tax=Ottowia sp. TaxID=1898956 RepID=UPI002CF1B256|nr:glutamate synthase subunit beta [Ottowia sp.]HMN20673.1 glutamate synthase subunit beta [Ottowia sp.]